MDGAVSGSAAMLAATMSTPMLSVTNPPMSQTGDGCTDETAQEKSNQSIQVSAGAVQRSCTE